MPNMDTICDATSTAVATIGAVVPPGIAGVWRPHSNRFARYAARRSASEEGRTLETCREPPGSDSSRTEREAEEELMSAFAYVR